MNAAIIRTGDNKDKSSTRTLATKVVLTSAPITMPNAAKDVISPFFANDEIINIVAVELCRKSVTKIPDIKDVKRFFVPVLIMRLS